MPEETKPAIETIETKELETKCFGIPLTFKVPATHEGYNQIAQRTGDACLEDAINYQLYHSTLGKLRSKFTAAIEKETGVAWKMKDSGRKKDGQPVMVPAESDGTYFARVCSETGKEADDFAELMQQVADSVYFDPSVTVRESGPKEVAKTYINTAKALFEGADTADKVQQICAKLLELNKDVKFEDDDQDDDGYTVTGLARLISANEARKRRAANLEKQYANVEDVA